MPEKHSQEQQTCDLHLKFFSPSSTQTTCPAQKWMVSTQTTGAFHSSRQSSFYVQCDCACK